jgi:hypothetical protein
LYQITKSLLPADFESVYEKEDMRRDVDRFVGFKSTEFYEDAVDTIVQQIKSDISLPCVPRFEEALAGYVGEIVCLEYGMGLLSGRGIEIKVSEAGEAIEETAMRVVSRIGETNDRVCVSLFPGLMRSSCGTVLTKELVMAMDA